MRPATLKLNVQARYLVALLKRFKVTFGLAALLFGLVPLIYVWIYRLPDGGRIGFGRALHHVYFLVFGQPSLEYVDNFVIELCNLLIPPFAIALVVDGVVRFGYLFFTKHRNDKEWISVICETMRNHVVVCGAGRVGYRVVHELQQLHQPLVVVEKKEDAAFVAVLRDEQAPVLIDDIKSPECLKRLNLKAAAAIVCATDDDLTNLNAALDARRLNPNIRVVMRLFDDDLVAKVREAFHAEALSSSALAGPAMALAAMDPRILHSFKVGGQTMVISPFVAGPAMAMTIGELHDRFGAWTLALRRGGGPEQFHPADAIAIATGDLLTVQITYPEYLKLRAHTGEQQPPAFFGAGSAPATEG